MEGTCKATATPSRRSRRRGTHQEEDKAEEHGGAEVEGIEDENKVEKTRKSEEGVEEKDKVEKIRKSQEGVEKKDKVENVEQMEEELNGNHCEKKLEGIDNKTSDDQKGVSSCRTILSEAETPVKVQTRQNKLKVAPKIKRIANTIPRGKPKSGRVWKENKKRFSEMVKDRPLRTSWELKMKDRQEKKLLKSLAQQLKDEKKQAKEDKRMRREENLRRRQENERKAEIVQVIRNPAKLKRARKKQLRNIEKRDTLMMSQAGKKLSQKKSAPSKAAGKKTSATS
ncbi:coiled-coil domain-containing protein 86 [Rana temporaria]|uniref:coiled-coil domain-containing protein 86 n=1 Tax=Rana temporaria TaxID=8407 RepID=UPI001AACBE0C|nr:coiled-coil domain-containing protein 86 [Rana temporaria]